MTLHTPRIGDNRPGAIAAAARMPLIRFGKVEVRPVAEGGRWRAVLD